ncbi:hypothetical protein NDU88_002858 [Pleurodeles waltl]|uniref:Uncharacterized protein n=1 Tax=Pleurodeles waltl TaxID=8319 RepID=A0AAV7VFL9_PLEWA|nr:hypothetical protein NDU88_002858 [Pleurodeles waltl]
MGKDRANKGTQQTRMDQYTAQNAGESLQKDPPSPSEKGAEPTGEQILAAIESFSRATHTEIAAIAVDVNLLRADLRVGAERSVATEQKVTYMQSDVEMLKASVAILDAQTRKLERGTGRSGTIRQECRNHCGGRVVGDSEGQRKCVLLRAELPDAIMPAVEAE